MIKKYITATFLLIAISFGLRAQNQEECTCCSEHYSYFDFWVGNWNVYNKTDDLIGTNHVVRIQDGCLVQENWVSDNNKNTGTSYNYYDKNDSTWNQVWISNSGNILNLKGNINENGTMILESDIITNSKGNYLNRISWTPNDNGTVTQKWEILNTKGETITKAFEGTYKKK